MQPLYCDKKVPPMQGTLIPLYMCQVSQVVQRFYQVELTPLKSPLKVIQPCPHRRNDRQTLKSMLPGNLLCFLEQAAAQACMLGGSILLSSHRQRLPKDVHLADNGCLRINRPAPSRVKPPRAVTGAGNLPACLQA